MLKMNDPELNKRKLAFMVKSPNLNTQEFEEYLHKRCALKGYTFGLAYDVIASEFPFFATLQYTEYAGGVTVHPLQMEFRNQQMIDAYYAQDTEIKIDFVKYFKNRVTSGVSNKYQNIHDHELEARQALVILPGSNKFDERVSIEKLKHIKKLFGHNVWVKPHPLTTHTVVGQIKDLFGEENVTPRQHNMYSLLLDSEIIYSSMLSESVLYAVCLDKRVEPIDAYFKTPLGSFYHMNKSLFYEDNPKLWVNKTFNDFRCGLFFPEIDTEWKSKLNKYLEYIDARRQKFRMMYIGAKKVKQDKNV